MPKSVKSLTVTQVKNAKPEAKMYKLSDGGGLSLWVYPSGNKNWVMRPQVNGKREELHRPFEGCTLAEARAWREEIRQKIRDGEPLTEKDAPEVTFRQIFAQWFERWAADVSPKYSKQVHSAVSANILPSLGDMTIESIRPVHIVDSLKGMEERGVLEYLKRTKTGIKLALDYAVARGLIDMNPASSVTPKAFKRHQSTHFRALPPEQLPDLIRALEQAHDTGKVKPLTYYLIYWQLLTMARPAEAAAARWAEIEEDKALWTIPASRMKKNRDHLIPLSASAVAILKTLENLNLEGVYLFEGNHGHMSRETVRMAMKRLNVDTTAHGLRSLARSYLGETRKFRREALELCLAHSIGDKTESAYDRAQYLDERREVLAYWAEAVMAQRREVKGF